MSEHTPLTDSETRSFAENFIQATGLTTADIRRMSQDPSTIAKWADQLRPKASLQAIERPVDILFKGTRTMTVSRLNSLGINTLGELAKWSPAELSLVWGFGPGLITHIISVLQAYGLRQVEHSSNLDEFSMWVLLPNTAIAHQQVFDDNVGKLTVGELRAAGRRYYEVTLPTEWAALGKTVDILVDKLLKGN